MAVWPICFNRHIHLGLGWLDFNPLAMAWKLGLTWLGSGLSCVLVPTTSTVYSTRLGKVEFDILQDISHTRPHSTTCASFIKPNTRSASHIV